MRPGGKVRRQARREPRLVLPTILRPRAGDFLLIGEEEMLKRDTGRAGKRALSAAVLLLLPLLAACASLTLGRYSLSPGELLSALTGTGNDPQARTVLMNIRLPRVVLALLVGGGLSAAGTAFQSLFANPLATPDTLGVASGASLGAALGLLLGFGLAAVQVLALAGGVLAVALTWLVSAGPQRRSIVTMVLAGLIMSSLFSALISLVKYVADPESQLPSITYWLMGSLSSADWGSLALGAPFLLGGTAVLLALRWRLNILPLSEDEAKATGVNLLALRTAVILAATMITAACVSMCGQVGWVGLLIPHICRMVFGGNNQRLVPASVCVGAAFLVIVDTLARTMTAAEVPISILTAIIGAPVFVALLRRTGGWSL